MLAPMTFRRTLLAAAALAPIGSFATTRGSGRITRREIALAPFGAIELGGDLALALRQQQPPGLHVESDDNVVPLLLAEVESGTLKLRLRERAVPTQWRLVVDVWKLEALAVGGSARVSAAALACKRLALRQSGSSNVAISGLAAETLTLALGGSTHLSLAGQANELDLSMGGSSRADLAALAVRRVAVSLGGSAQAGVAAGGSLSGSVGGSAQLRYRGAPRLAVSRGGSGSIERMP
jgi:hypothetical protein